MLLATMAFTQVAKDKVRQQFHIMQTQRLIRHTNMLLLDNFQSIMDSVDDPLWNPKTLGVKHGDDYNHSN